MCPLPQCSSIPGLLKPPILHVNSTLNLKAVCVTPVPSLEKSNTEKAASTNLLLPSTTPQFLSPNFIPNNNFLNIPVERSGSAPVGSNLSLNHLLPPVLNQERCASNLSLNLANNCLGNQNINTEDGLNSSTTEPGNERKVLL